MENPETADDDPVGHDLSTTSGKESGVVKTSEMVAVQLTGCNGVDLEQLHNAIEKSMNLSRNKTKFLTEAFISQGTKEQAQNSRSVNFII